MGNIEIRDPSNQKRRTQIFNPTKSYAHSYSHEGKSITQRFQKSSNYSPIRFSKTYEPRKEFALTERKASQQQPFIQNSFRNSLVFNQQTEGYKKSITLNSRYSKQNKKKSLQIQNDPEQVSNSYKATGRIVANSKKLNDDSKTIRTFNAILNRQIPVENPLQTKEIIKKVRNFNDFLNQIKRKLKEDKQEALLRNKSQLENLHKNKPFKINQKLLHNFTPTKIEFTSGEDDLEKTKSMRRIEVALKLENQKLELQKYRRLVQRQLSKTHSIENISLCTKSSGEKILTIQYESILPQKVFSCNNSKSTLRQLSQKPSMQVKYQQIILKYRKIKQQSNNKKVLASATDQRIIMLKKLKFKYEQMYHQMMNLGKTIQQYERNMIKGNAKKSLENKILIQDESEYNSQLSLYNKQQSNLEIKLNRKFNAQSGCALEAQSKIQRIEGLFEKLNELQEQYSQTDRGICQAISNSNSDSQTQQPQTY